MTYWLNIFLLHVSISCSDRNLVLLHMWIIICPGFNQPRTNWSASIIWGRGNGKYSVLIQICLQLFIGSLLNYPCQSRWNWTRPVLAVHVASLIWAFISAVGDNMLSDTSSSISQKHELQVGQRCAVRCFFFFLPFLRKSDSFIFMLTSVVRVWQHIDRFGAISSKATQRSVGRVVKSICRWTWFDPDEVAG